MENSFFYQDREITYTIITNKRLKNLYITIDPSLGVIVKNPNFPLKKVKSIVEDKAKWINEKLLHVKSRLSIDKIYNEEKKVLLFGKKESLHVKGNLANFYKKKTEEILPSLVEKWAFQMNLKPTNITYRKTKRRWGSCSADNSLSFTSSLCQLPIEAIEYIVVHELSHIQHKHHKRSFWLHVEKFFPQYKECEKVIKNYSPQI